MLTSEQTGEHLFHFFRENEIEIADAFDAVRDEINHHFVPDVEPFGVMVHGFGDERDARHVAEGGDEILALKFAMKLAVLNLPAGKAGHELVDFVVG